MGPLCQKTISLRNPHTGWGRYARVLYHFRFHLQNGVVMPEDYAIRESIHRIGLLYQRYETLHMPARTSSLPAGSYKGIIIANKKLDIVMRFEEGFQLND